MVLLVFWKKLEWSFLLESMSKSQPIPAFLPGEFLLPPLGALSARQTHQTGSGAKGVASQPVLCSDRGPLRVTAAKTSFGLNPGLPVPLVKVSDRASPGSMGEGLWRLVESQLSVKTSYHRKKNSSAVEEHYRGLTGFLNLTGLPIIPVGNYLSFLILFFSFFHRLSPQYPLPPPPPVTTLLSKYL